MTRRLDCRQSLTALLAVAGNIMCDVVSVIMQTSCYRSIISLELAYEIQVVVRIRRDVS